MSDLVKNKMYKISHFLSKTNHRFMYLTYKHNQIQYTSKYIKRQKKVMVIDKDCNTVWLS